MQTHRVTRKQPRGKVTPGEALKFRPLTAQIIQQEFQALVATGPDASAFRRLASRLNRWIAASPLDDADLVEMVESSINVVNVN